MKMCLMTFDEAREVYGREYPTEIDFFDGYIFGLRKDSIPWGENVEVDIETLDSSNNLSTYELNGFFVPTCMFKIDDTNLDKKPFANDVLRYGTILTDDELFDRCDDMAAEVRIRLFSYENVIYYIKMINDEVEEFKKVGTDEH